MKKLFKTILLASCAVILSTSLALAALTLDAAKSQGLVGEKPDGLLGVVSSNPDAQTLANQTNAERLQKYKEIAAKNGTQVTQVQALAGKKLIESAGAGQYVMTASGSWVKK